VPADIVLLADTPIALLLTLPAVSSSVAVEFVVALELVVPDPCASLLVLAVTVRAGALVVAAPLGDPPEVEM
jgi:hypothetical protein